MNKIYMIKELMKKVEVGKEIIEKFPHLRAEYVDETLEYSKILYQLLKESALP